MASLPEGGATSSSKVDCCACAGDSVREDDVLLQVETDKVTIDVRYTASEPGVLKEYLVAEEDTVSVGQDVVRIETGACVRAAPAGCSAHLWL